MCVVPSCVWCRGRSVCSYGTTSSVSQYVSESDSGTCEPHWGAALNGPPAGVVGKRVCTCAAGVLQPSLQQLCYQYCSIAVWAWGLASACGMGHGAWSMGHGTCMGHEAWGMGEIGIGSGRRVGGRAVYRHGARGMRHVARGLGHAARGLGHAARGTGLGAWHMHGAWSMGYG